MPDLHKAHMERCIQLACLGAGYVAPNPMVGAVLVYENRIIGEGWHQQFGGPHAEVNCINSVDEINQSLIPLSTLYISLEPCAHYGKTPPCTKLIIEQQIKKVVVGCRDPFEAVNGKGIEQLKKEGIEVIVGILERECRQLNQRFFCFHQLHRPYIILKWAQSRDGFMAGNTNERLLITHQETNRLVHQWRSEEAAILVGTTTALKDNPSLTNRLWHGKSPLRLVIDRHLSLPSALTMFNDRQPLVVYNEQKEGVEGNVRYVQLKPSKSFIPQIIDDCYQQQIQSILVEGGSVLLQSFLEEGYWDELRILTNQQLYVSEGLASPIIPAIPPIKKLQIAADEISFYYHSQLSAV